MEEVKFTDKRWDPSKTRWTEEDLLACIPRAMARYAKDCSAIPDKSYMHLAYREPRTHEVNVNGIRQALAAIENLKGPSQADKASARSELQGFLARAPQQKPVRHIPDLASLNATFFQDLAAPLSGVEPVTAPAPQRAITPAPNEALLRALDLFNRQQSGEYFESDKVANLQPEAHLNGLDLTREMGMNPALIPPIPLSEGAIEELAAVTSLKSTNGVNGVVDRDFAALPDYEALGITRPAGDATEKELAYFAGATKLDGTPLTSADIFSVGAMLVSSDLITQLMSYIPPLELARLGYILKTRMIKSDQDHNRRVMSGNFSIVDPMIGTDPNAKLHMDHPLLGKAPLTGLTARLLFQKVGSDPAQMAAVESVMMGKLQNLSIAFGYGGKTCALCGESPILNSIKAQEKIIGFIIPPETNVDLCKMGDMSGGYSWDQPMAMIRTPAQTEGGFVYRQVTMINAGEDGIIQIEPQFAANLLLSKGSVLMPMMSAGWFFGDRCKFHGRVGSYAQDGRRVIGAFTNLRAMLNTAIVDKGADPNAKLVLTPSLKY
jgi:hypothetical protein